MYLLERLEKVHIINMAGLRTEIKIDKMRLPLELSRLLPSVLSFHGCTRGKASSNWPLRRPRSYRRRLYDAALEPMVPKVQSVCPSYKGVLDSIAKMKSSYSAYDMALVQHIRQTIKNEGYQVMGICHRLAVKQRTEWLTRNHHKRQLFGKDINAIKAIIVECEKIDWLIPIAVVYGSQILSISEVKELCKLPSLEDHRAQTVQLLSVPPNELISTLNYHIMDTIRILDSIRNEKKPL
uniref:TIR domain-containing protein n=1 Tax=Loa loa TaxID=7209 RepID=A0A1I7W2I8_LOALO